MGPISSLETSVRNYHFTVRNMSKECTSQVCNWLEINVLQFVLLNKCNLPSVLSVTSVHRGQHAAPKETVTMSHTVRDWTIKKEYRTLISVILRDGEL